VLLFLLHETDTMRTAWKFVVVGVLAALLIGLA
jgi:hypothetical protein